MQGVAYERRDTGKRQVEGLFTNMGQHMNGCLTAYIKDGINRMRKKTIDHNDGRTKHNGLKVRRINNDAVVAWGNEMGMMDAMR